VYTNIQLLRLVAASMVVFFHAIPIFINETDAAYFKILRLSGFAGVDIFFVISGFIIWHTTEKFNGLNQAIYFIAKRFTRIFAGYWPFFLLAVCLSLFYNNDNFTNLDMVGSLFLLPIPINERLLPISWTLTFELYFYLSFTILLLLSPRNRIKILISAFIIIFLINFVGYIFFGFYSIDFFSTTSLTHRISFSPYNLEFIAGALIASIHSSITPRRSAYYFFVSCLLFGAGILFNLNYAESRIDEGFYVVERVLFFGTGAICLLLFMLSLEKREITPVPKVSILLGGASYSIYLSHVLILDIVAHSNLANYLSGHILLITTYAFILVYSALHYSFIEKPLYTYLKTAFIRQNKLNHK
jgi:peptidoglycan/LPS O-acetylase OafA/YrhL